MKDRNLNRLKEVLAVPTYSRNEGLMIAYLKGVLDEKGYEYYLDSLSNIYVTKGKTEWFPCFVAHTDTVHMINHNMKVVQFEEEGKTILTGIDTTTMKPSGIGGDDKCGIYLALEMLDTLDNVKVAFFVSEEIGCVGSRAADPEFFTNVGYAIQYDSPKGDSMSLTLMGKRLFGEGSGFEDKVGGLILEHGIDDWARHPYTDVWPLMDKFNFSCLNLAAGYYNYHTDNEYVIVEDVQNGFELGIKLHEELGENRYELPEEVKPTYKSNWYGGYGGYGSRDVDPYEVPTTRRLISEDNDDDDDGDTVEGTWTEVNDELDLGPNLHNEGDANIGEEDGWEDVFDYDDFNGGFSIQQYGTVKGEEFDY